ncbi:MAG: thiaminase II [Actinomycetota bacterium]
MSGERRSATRSGFTGELWDAIGPIYAEILAHPFLLGLTDGTLPKDRFRHYVVQDALYLRDYARVLSLTGVRSPSEEGLVMFDEHAIGAITVERSLHEGFLGELGLTQEDLDRTPMAPTTLAYTSYLLRTAALGDYHEALGAVLPCYWIYARVGEALLERGSPDPMYRRWIETYGGEEFQGLVEAVLDLTDRACADLSPPQREAARNAFVTTSRYEWMFWNMGWTLEGWPV